MTVPCQYCGEPTVGLLRGRKRKFCNDRCRADHHRRKRRHLTVASPAKVGDTPVEPPPPMDDLGAWATWVRATYALDETHEALLRMTLEADALYRQARAAIARDGLLSGDGRAHPALAVIRDTRTAIMRLIDSLDLEDTGHGQTETPAARGGYPRAI